MKTFFTISVFISLLLFPGFLKSQTGTYVVLSAVSDTSDTYYDVAETIANYRSAQIITFNPLNVDSLLPILTAIEPRYVAIVIKPIDLDINFVRHFLMMSTDIDSDPFSDFSYGYITGATGQDALNFVNNIIYAESQNIQNFPLNCSGYAASSLNLIYTTPGDYMSYLNPPVYSAIYLETNDNGSGLDYFMANTSNMENNKLLDIGHNGDAHMLWLFEGGNTNPVPPVWNYDPAKIEDTAYARVGLSSFEIGTLNLYPAVAFNGACHSGEPKKVMVEGDIAATFGDTQGYTEFYTMSDTFSFALEILQTGITGYFAPCGANNANDQGEDVYNAFLYDEPLGDIHKRSNDGVVMGFLGNRPELEIYVQGNWGYGCDVNSSGSFDPNDWSGACYMLGGKANRIYFGDPLFDPYADNHSSSLNITQAILDSVNQTILDVQVVFNKPSSPYFPVWDKFHHGDTRIYIPVELPDYVSSVTGFDVIDSSGIYHMVIHALEEFDGKKIMHIEVDIPDDMYSTINYDITFRINYISTSGIPTITSKYLTVYPNPANENVCFEFDNNDNSPLTITIYNSEGKIVDMIRSITGKSITYNTGKLSAGMYLVKLYNKYGLITEEKLTVN